MINVNLMHSPSSKVLPNKLLFWAPKQNHLLKKKSVKKKSSVVHICRTFVHSALNLALDITIY